MIDPLVIKSRFVPVSKEELQQRHFLSDKELDLIFVNGEHTLRLYTLDQVKDFLGLLSTIIQRKKERDEEAYKNKGTIVIVELISPEIDEKAKWRIVDITGHEISLASVHKYGQNEVQPRDRNSVSTGDIIHWLDDCKYFIRGDSPNEGFKKLTEKEYQAYRYFCS